MPANPNDQPTILALETSSGACSAALLHQGAITQHLELAPRRQGDLLLGMLDALLKAAELKLSEVDVIAFGQGPGAFTGVRIGTAVAQGAAFGANRPLLGISSLAGLAHAGWRHYGGGEQRLFAAIDARIGEIYCGAFAVNGQGQAQPLGSETVTTPEKLTVPEIAVTHGVGNAWALYDEPLRARIDLAQAQIASTIHGEAQDIAALARWSLDQACAAELAQPVYLRDQVAAIPGSALLDSAPVAA